MSKPRESAHEAENEPDEIAWRLHTIAEALVGQIRDVVLSYIDDQGKFPDTARDDVYDYLTGVEFLLEAETLRQMLVLQRSLEKSVRMTNKVIADNEKYFYSRVEAGISSVLDLAEKYASATAVDAKGYDYAGDFEEEGEFTDTVSDLLSSLEGHNSDEGRKLDALRPRFVASIDRLRAVGTRFDLPRGGKPKSDAGE